MNLKKKLILLGIVKDNIFLDLYCDLIYKNIDSPKNSKTQAHHIVPRCYFTYVKQWVVNKNNLVNLSVDQHILAHEYLDKCATEEFRKVLSFNGLGSNYIKNKEELEKNLKANKEFNEKYWTPERRKQASIDSKNRYNKEQLDKARLKANIKRQKLYTFDGETHNINGWAKKYGLHHEIVRRRILKGEKPN